MGWKILIERQERVLHANFYTVLHQGASRASPKGLGGEIRKKHKTETRRPGKKKRRSKVQKKTTRLENGTSLPRKIYQSKGGCEGNWTSGLREKKVGRTHEKENKKESLIYELQ